MKKSLLSLLMVSSAICVSAQGKYALEEGESHDAGDVITSVPNITLTFGTGGNKFGAAKAGTQVDGYTAFTEGNGTNGNSENGTVYFLNPSIDGNVTVAVILNSGKAFHVNEDGTDLEQYSGVSVSEKYYGTYSFNVKAGSTYKFWCDGSKLGFYGFEFSDEVVDEGPAQEVTEFLYANASAETNAEGFSQITYQDGATLTLLNNTDNKKWSNGSSIKVDGKNYTSIKLSNGVQNYFTAPEGKVIKNVKIYSYVNDTNVTTSYWKEFNGVNHTLEEGAMASAKDGANPDVFEFNATEDDCITSFTFTNSGKQLCFVLKVEYYKSDETPAIKYMVNTTAGVEGIGFATVCLPYDANYYNLDHVYTGTIDGNTLVLEDLDRNNAVPANTAVIVAGKLNGSYAVYKSENAASPLTKANDLQGTVKPIPTPANACVLSVVEGVVGFYSASNFKTIPANKAYLVVSNSGAPIRIAIGDTGISNLATEKALAEQLFDIQGRKVEAIQGLGIQNGKITFVK